MWRRMFRRRQRDAQITALRAPASVPDTVPDVEIPPPAPLVDWPRIHSTHPNWWQVHRVEVCGLETNYVLIAEVRSEDEAFRVAAQQASQVRIRKWGSQERDYHSMRPPAMVITGTVSRVDD